MRAYPGASRRQRAVVWIVSRLHPQLVREPERVILAAAIGLTGASTLLSATEGGAGSLSVLLPVWLIVEWALSLVAGGSFTLIGMFTAQRWLERLGLALTILGCFVNSVALIYVQQTPRAIIIAGIYVAIGLACSIRLLVSSAVSATVPKTTKG